MKPVPPHRWILWPGLALSLSIIVFGVLLSRETELIAEETDSRPVEYFARSLQEELDRLEHRYELRLLEVFRRVRDRDFLIAETAPERIHGLLSLSILHPEGSIGEDRLVAGEGLEPEITFRSIETGKHRLRQEAFFHDGPASGWLRRNGARTLYFWEREGMSSIRIATIDPAAVGERIDDWIATNRRIPRVLLESYPGSVEITRSGQPHWELPDRDRRIDEVPLSAVIPAKNVFGTWMVKAQHPVHRQVLWNWPVLFGGSLLGLALGLASWRISTAYRSATRLAEQRVSFVNQASHELRTPITNILLFSDLAADSLGGDHPRASGKIALIREEAERLGRLVDNVLAFSRQERGDPAHSFTTIVPDDLLEQLRETFEPSFSRKEIRMNLDLDSAAPFRTDPDVLSQILTNLFSNIEKYAAAGKRAEVRSSIEEGVLRIVVADRGPGIPAGAERIVFQDFGRLRSDVAEGACGTGLGLAIARKLARGLGGDIRLLGSKIGASFEVVIPEEPLS